MQLIDTEQRVHVCQPAETIWKVDGGGHAGGVLRQRR